MTATSSESIAGRLCAVRAATAGQDPIGAGSTIARLLAMELPTPWGEGLFNADPEGTLLERMRHVHQSYIARLRESGELERVFANGSPGFYGIAPDREWSDPAIRRVLLITRPEGAFSQFEIQELHFPFESERLLDLLRAFFEAPETLDSFAEFRVEHGGQREFFVCTHGQVDICCAKLGVPLYRRARDAAPQVRAWRMTHFGGHRFAPTAWEFPSGYKWAFLDDERTRQVLDRDGDDADLRMHVRGWSGVPGKVQLLDRAGLERFGWDWLSYRRRGEVLEEDNEAKRWRVRLEFESPSGHAGAYEGVVVVARELHEPGCGQHFGEYDFWAPEYRLESFVEVEVSPARA